MTFWSSLFTSCQLDEPGKSSLSKISQEPRKAGNDWLCQGMGCLQSGFDPFAILERQLPRYHHDFIDDTVNAQIADLRLGCPKITAPRQKVVG